MPKQGQSRYPDPVHRRLRIFSFDPAADISLETAGISRCEIQVPWEPVGPGPVGEYIEVVDLDPSSNCIYNPIDLMDINLLASNGLEPSTGNPQFHQQMVYAVAMKTIFNFEQVLGRHIQWSERVIDENNEYIAEPDRRYVERLRIYPHALREQNAFYSPQKKALLFGYFNATTSDPRDELPGGVVFTCLSHDIIAHETTHAIIDGLHRRLLDATNHDMLAFHEAFADIVAIFQHFTLPGVLLDQIQRTRGDLRIDNLLVKLASQFARATGRGGALRNALGDRRPSGGRMEPGPEKLGNTIRPHDRGAILVAAVFEAFLRIYENRIEDLRRIATGGTGVLPKGDIHPDLAGRLAVEATNASQHVLNICIRALDYLPPVDLTFGDFLRSLITADTDFYPNDQRHYRLAFIESFRERGIYPSDVRTLSEDSLRWAPIRETWEELKDFLPPPDVLRTMAYAYDCENLLVPRLNDFNKKLLSSRRKSPDVMARQFLECCWIQHGKPESDPCDNQSRYRRYSLEREFAKFLHCWIMFYAESNVKSKAKSPEEMENWFNKIGYNFGLDLKQALEYKDNSYMSRLEVHAVRPTIRLRPDGRSRVELVVLLTQSNRRVLPGREGENSEIGNGNDAINYKFRGGCTLLIDPEQGIVRYAIGKNLLSERRRNAHEAFLNNRLDSLGAEAIDRYGLRIGEHYGNIEDKKKPSTTIEPFALVHRHQEIGDEYDG